MWVVGFFFSRFPFIYKAKINVFIKKHSWKYDQVALVKEDAKLCKFRDFTWVTTISVTLHLNKVLLGNISEERYEINHNSNESSCVKFQRTIWFSSMTYVYQS